jgi:hypothetical protein
LKLTKDAHAEIKAITGKIIEENLDRPLKTLKIFKT